MNEYDMIVLVSFFITVTIITINYFIERKKNK